LPEIKSILFPSSGYSTPGGGDYNYTKYIRVKRQQTLTCQCQLTSASNHKLRTTYKAADIRQTNVGQHVLARPTKVCCMFKMLANILCCPTMLAVYEHVLCWSTCAKSCAVIGWLCKHRGGAD